MGMSLNELTDTVNKSEVASIASIINRIITRAANPNTSVGELCDIISVDPPLCAKVLRRANSAYYAMPGRISTIQDAIVLLGFGVVREMALSLAVASMFGKDDTIGGYSRKRLWRHCLGVATCVKLICQSEFKQSGDDMYAAALLHDFGMIVENQFLLRQFKTVIAMVEHSGKTLVEAEHAMFGFTHCEAGGSVLASWHLPEQVVEGAASHHAPYKDGTKHSTAAKLIFVAEHHFKSKTEDFSLHVVSKPDEVCKAMKELNLTEKGVEFILADTVETLSAIEQVGGLFG